MYIKVYGSGINRKTKNTYNFFIDESKRYASSDAIIKKQ